MPGKQTAPLLDLRAQQHVARIRIDARIDRGDGRAERAIRIRIHMQRHFQPRPQTRRVTRGHGEVDLEIAVILQRRDHRAGRCIVADVDPADADRACEWRLDRLVGEPCLGLRELRTRALEIGARSIELRLRNALALDELGIALEQELRELQRRG